MITKLLRRALGQAFSQAPKATKAARRVGVPTRDAGIVGRVGPGGGGLETGVVARPITRPSSVNVRPNNTPYTGTLQPNTAPSYVGSQTSSPSLLQRAVGYGGRGLQILGGVDVANKIRKGDYTGAAVEAALLTPGKTLGAARGLLFNPAGLTAAALVGTEALAPASVADGTLEGAPTLTPEQERIAKESQEKLIDSGSVRPVKGSTASITTGRTFQSEPRRDPPTREELERRAYEQEVSRVAQQADPFFTAGGAPMVNYTAEQGMAINKALYGDMLTPNTPNPLMAGLTYDQTNPTMQGKNYNMENPVGVQQSSAQSLADYYRNGMMEQQTQGMGSEPGLESVLSPEDREMFLGQLRNFRPGGPG